MKNKRITISTFTQGGAKSLAKTYTEMGWKLLSTQAKLNKSTTLWEIKFSVPEDQL